MRAHPEPIGHYAPLARSPLPQAATPPTVLFVTADRERGHAGDQSTRHYATTTPDAQRLIAAVHPRLVVVDWDEPSLSGREICAAAAAAGSSVLVLTSAVESVPSILKAGCQGVLLKPFAPSILASRIGRVLKETERTLVQRHAAPRPGTNRVWPDVSCPSCGTPGVTSFDFSSYRRMWYACLACETTWLGPRKE